MRPSTHAATSGVAAHGAFAVSQSIPLAVTTFAAGILIDLDHLPEYVREYGLRLDLRRFFEVYRATRFRKLYLVLHSWELLVLTAAAAWLTRWNPWITGVLLGAGLHLLLDQAGNHVRVCGYSLIWRWRNGFRVGALKSGAGMR